MRAVVTVMGQDKKGIIAKTASLLAENDINILDITQTIVQNIFTMVMFVGIDDSKLDFTALGEALDRLGKEMDVEIRIQHEDIFQSMHRI